MAAFCFLSSAFYFCFYIANQNYLVPQVLTDHQQIEPNLLLAVFEDPVVDLLLGQLNPLLFGFVLAQQDGSFL